MKIKDHFIDKVLKNILAMSNTDIKKEAKVFVNEKIKKTFNQIDINNTIGKSTEALIKQVEYLDNLIRKIDKSTDDEILELSISDNSIETFISGMKNLGANI